MLVLICSIFLLISLVASATTYRRLLTNPLIIFFSVWLLMFLGYESDVYFDFFSVRISQKAEFFYFLSFLSFFIGGMLVLIPRFNKPLPYEFMPRSEPLSMRQVNTLYKWTLALIVALCFGITIKYAVLVQSGYGNPINQLYEIRRDFANGLLAFPTYFGLITVVGNVAVVNLGILLVSSYRSRWVILMLAVVLLCAFANDALTADKGSIKQAVLLVGTVALTGAVFGKELRIKHLLGYGLLFIAFLGLLSTITASDPKTNESIAVITTSTFVSRQTSCIFFKPPTATHSWPRASNPSFHAS